MAELAVAAIAQIDEGKVVPTKTVFPVTLVERGTTWTQISISPLQVRGALSGEWGGMLLPVGAFSSHWQIAKLLRSWASSEADCECPLYWIVNIFLSSKNFPVSCHIVYSGVFLKHFRIQYDSWFFCIAGNYSVIFLLYKKTLRAELIRCIRNMTCGCDKKWSNFRKKTRKIK